MRHSTETIGHLSEPAHQAIGTMRHAARTTRHAARTMPHATGPIDHLSEPTDHKSKAIEHAAKTMVHQTREMDHSVERVHREPRTTVYPVNFGAHLSERARQARGKGEHPTGMRNHAALTAQHHAKIAGGPPRTLVLAPET